MNASCFLVKEEEALLQAQLQLQVSGDAVITSSLHMEDGGSINLTEISSEIHEIGFQHLY